MRVIAIRFINTIPSYSSALTKIESGSGVTKALAKLKGTKDIPGSITGDQSGLFNANSKAPEFKGITQWLDTTGAQF
jgi:hypothetical protein